MYILAISVWESWWHSLYAEGLNRNSSGIWWRLLVSIWDLTQTLVLHRIFIIKIKLSIIGPSICFYPSNVMFKNQLALSGCMLFTKDIVFWYKMIWAIGCSVEVFGKGFTIFESSSCYRKVLSWQKYFVYIVGARTQFRPLWSSDFYHLTVRSKKTT